MKLGIKKPWRSRKEIKNLEIKIIKISKNIEDHFIDLSYNMEEYRGSYIYHKRLELNFELADVRQLASELNSCYWFSFNFHPDYEAATSRVRIMSIAIRKELEKRKERGYK